MKKKTKIVLIVIVIAVILVSFIGGQAYAKYMSKITGNGVGEIAQWRFKVNENEEKMQTISLNSTIYNFTLANGRIAPGTAGSFEINIDGSGAGVAIFYTVNFQNETEKPKNLKFKYDGKEFESIELLNHWIVGTIHGDTDAQQRSFIIEWEWPYETGNTPEEIAENDERDTIDAKNISDYRFDVVVTGTQVQPQK
ncbi:putative uncharacterized protein [Clostridium sp. CAG:470]|nr:MAG: hypothetical protein BHW03_00220 [Clostridium sp. 28_17]CDE14679.1 putative uncharacterized protein [Clostridium sp. CAG:470]